MILLLYTSVTTTNKPDQQNRVDIELICQSDSNNEDHGGFGAAPDEDVTLDLSSFLGAASVTLRWHYYDPNCNDFEGCERRDQLLTTRKRYSGQKNFINASIGRGLRDCMSTISAPLE